MSKRYVDNAMNRSLGRVGMVHGTAVHSRSSISSSSVSSGYSVSPVAVSPSSRSSASSDSSVRTYVDNALNRRLGRVGLEHGTAVHSSSSVSSVSNASNSSRTYVDNAHNRSLGRVGLEHGTAVHSNKNPLTWTYDSKAGDYRPTGTPVKRTYADNAYNRRLGRVGLELGSAVQSVAPTKSAAAEKTQKPVKVYVDNAMNRRLGRVGLALGSAPMTPVKKCGPGQRKAKEVLRHVVPQVNQSVDVHVYPQPDLRSVYRWIEEEKTQVQEYGSEVEVWDQVEGIVNRHQAARSTRKLKTQVPDWLKSGDVINFSDLEIGDRLGGGGFGDVHVAIWKEEVTVCVKKLRVQRVSEKKRIQFEDEVRILSSLKHKNIVSFFGACVTTPNLAIVMEFMRRGSLYDVIHLEEQQYTDDQKYSLISDMVSAVEFIHRQDMAHRDIKSMNVLVCEEVHHCKLGDFGLAIRQEIEHQSSVTDHAVVGTLVYCPLEVLEGDKLSLEQFKSVDVYSLAITVIELMTERKPFDGLNQHQVRRAVKEGENTDLQMIDQPVLKRLLSNSISRRPQSRPTAKQFKTMFQEVVDMEQRNRSFSASC